MSEKREIVVTCGLQEGSIGRVEQRLLEAGFEIDNVLEFTGNIVGHWGKSLDLLRALPEVDAVEESTMNEPQ